MTGKLAKEPGRRRSQVERRAATRRELLDAAEALIAERGFAQASLSAIADRAGVSKGAVYHHFQSKDDLLLALLDSQFEARIAAVGRITGPDRMTEEIPFDRRWNLLFLEFVVRAARDEIFARKFRARLDRLRLRSTEGVRSYLESAGIETNLTPEELALAVAALGNGLAIEGLIHPDWSSDAIYGELLGLLVRGLTDHEADTKKGQSA